jgi:hypothetical protein
MVNVFDDSTGETCEGEGRRIEKSDSECYPRDDPASVRVLMSGGIGFPCGYESENQTEDGHKYSALLWETPVTYMRRWSKRKV